MSNPIRESVYTLMKQIGRPLTRETRDRVSSLEATQLEAVRSINTLKEVLAPTMHGVWRGGLAEGMAVGLDNTASPEQTTKYRGELEFWVKLVKQPGAFDTFPWDFEEKYTEWQTGRMNTLAEWLGLDAGEEMDAWCAERTAVEIGSGPYPSISVRRWAHGFAVDPLAEGYLKEDLPPACARALTFLPSAGERVPLVSDTADVVVIENVLDHCERPDTVMREILRLLKPGGLCWLLVDLMDYSDEMHPSPMNEERLRTMFADTGYETVRDKMTTSHKSHGEAYGECRALLRKPTTAEPEVVVRRDQAAHA